MRDNLRLLPPESRRAPEAPARGIARDAGAKPTERKVHAILEHVLAAEKAYVYAIFRTTKSVGDPTNEAVRGDLDLFVALREARAAAIERIRASTRAEREVRRSSAGQYSMRWMLRAMLGHEWNHRREIEERLGRYASRRSPTRSLTPRAGYPTGRARRSTTRTPCR